MNTIYPKAYIYYLQDPSWVSQTCYVGQTRQTLQERLRGHKKDTKRIKKNGLNKYSANWINSLLQRDVQPEMIILEQLEHVTQEQINEAEKWHIKMFNKLGIPIANGTDGGHSGTPTPEVAKKISNTLKRKYASGELKPTFKGRKHTEESKQKQRERHIGKKASAETKQKQSAVRKGMP